ncbi:MAG: ABC transporter permease [Lachnospiraceae bacterium]|nr:ABC transporter permease [Lachnospiraceae bacterium]
MKLSAWKYVKNNKQVCAVLISALSLSFMTMYVIYVLLQTTVESFRPIMLELPKKISYASITGSSYGLDVNGYDTYEELEAAYNDRQAQLIERLKSRPGISDAFHTQIIYSIYKSVVGQQTFETPLMEPERIPAFLDHMEAVLTEGRMPSGDGEILVDETVMKNMGYRIGGYFMEDWYGEIFKIVGSIRSDYMVSVGTPMGGTNNGWYIVVLGDESVKDLTSVLIEERIAVKSSDEIFDGVHYEENYNTQVEELIGDVIDVILIVVMVFLSVLVLVAYASYMRNRVSEYCLYSSIGFGRGDIYGMMMREVFIIFGISATAGVVLSLAGGYLVNTLVINPKGLIGHVFYAGQMVRILSTYIFMIGILQIPALNCIFKIRTIDAVEK